MKAIELSKRLVKYSTLTVEFDCKDIECKDCLFCVNGDCYGLSVVYDWKKMSKAVKKLDPLKEIDSNFLSQFKNDTAKLSTTCINCKKEFEFVVSVESFIKYIDGNPKIQDALPELTPGERELFISGLCSKCFDEATIEIEDIFSEE